MNATGLLALALAAGCAALMGFAIQRGATCTVAAVDELLTKRRATRLVAMAEASLWVAGGLLLAAALTPLPAMPAGFALSGWTLAGGVLLGLGAWLNGACVFGAVARLGSGEWAYALTPAGYFLGCATVTLLFAPAAPQPLATPSPLFAAPAAALPAVALLAAGRGAQLLRRRRWTPHAATTVIGITFLFSLLAAGAWAYTDLLADLARAMAHRLGARALLFGALLAGAAWGGWTAGRWQARAPTPAQAARCLAGGALMGWGTLLIPGSNDGLILVGMPLLRPYAWVAFATMVFTIAAAMVVSRRQFSLFRPAAPEPDRRA